ncbi:MAG: tRNA 4-thiouridine(8) synthase ThiI [Clostridia bacterium]|nr:tRNA 4-thiouridine(8) synthase ThiI [Clostridia bacterium]
MKEIILLKEGELALKGLNRVNFEDKLIKNIKFRFRDLGKFTFTRSQSAVAIEAVNEEVDFEEAVERLKKVFGIVAFSRAAIAEKDIESIKATAKEYLHEQIMSAKTFKVEAKRSDKKFPMTSPEISREVGAHILRNYPHIKVDVHNPDLKITVEIRERAYVRGNQIKGIGGMPVGSAGKAAVLMSGGIDSPVAAYMMAKRGVQLTAIHFAAPPYTSMKAEMKVRDLVKKVSEYAGRIYFAVVPFTEIQEKIKDECPEDLFTLIMRRLMMEIATRIAEKDECHALITGESLGQVASQTLLALGVTDEATPLPVFRPCIGMDKQEIISIARQIDTFETSILPYEDCCTVFTPRHPRTRPTLEQVKEAQALVDWEELIEKAIAETRYEPIN